MLQMHPTRLNLQDVRGEHACVLPAAGHKSSSRSAGVSAYCGRHAVAGHYCGRALAHRQAGGAHMRVSVEVAVEVDERGGAAGRAAHGHLVEADGRHIVQEAPLARARRAEIKDRQQRPALGSSSASYVSAYPTASC